MLTKSILVGYFVPIQGTVIDEAKLMLLWRKAWTKAGFDPLVCNESHARKHPYFAEYHQRISELPTIDPLPLHLARFHRWLAAAGIAEASERRVALVEFDVMPYAFATDGRGRPGRDMVVDGGAWLVQGHAQHFLEQAKRFADYVPSDADMKDGRPHVTDQSILGQQMETHNFRDNVKTYGEDGWEAALAVHYPRNVTPAPRWEKIPQLRPLEL